MLFQDMRGAVSRYERCCFEIWKVLFRDMGGAEFVGERWVLILTVIIFLFTRFLHSLQLTNN